MRTLGLLLLAAILHAQPPRVLFTEADRDRINAQAASQVWAASVKSTLIDAANAWPAPHLTKFGLRELALPPEGGQWPHHYVCPTHGVRLEFRPPTTNRCPIDGRTYTGWPYDQAVWSDRHDDLANMARDLGLAYQLTGDRAHAVKSAWILNEYAAKYSGYRLHDTNDRVSRPAAKVGAQTLDESIWLIAIAWAYDLIRESGVLTDEQRGRIERDLIRASAATVRAYDAGISNWQSWHNAGMAAAGFALADRDLINHSIDGPSGFRFQMRNSVLDDGFWYEGAWGYHFYALDALTRTAEMAARNGIDLWSEPEMGALFRTPGRLMFADGSLPMFNDTGPLNLFTQDGLYEYAYARLADPALLGVLGRRSRGRNALLWGAPELAASAKPKLESALFEKAGYAVLRASANDHAVIMKFGPHGGGHGHYDKLGITSYAHGGVLAVDPGTQSYAAPTHATWDLMTIAHNTMSVDERRQSEATGKLLWQQAGDGYSAVSADAGPAYSFANLRRTLVTTAEYALDISSATATDSADHTFDWAHHNYGTVRTELPLESWSGFGRANGYQHLTGNRAASTTDAWQLTFDGTPVTPIPYGVTWASTAAVSGRFELSRERAYRGVGSAKASYAWSGAGYLLLTTPALNEPPATKPRGLRAQVYGDGSGHRLTLRLHDATDERFVVTVGPVTWSGWREVQVTNPERWSHFGGNNDGVFDAPVRNVTVAIDQTAGGPARGEWWFDDFTIDYDDGSYVAADFEGGLRHLRVWMLGDPETTVVTGSGLGPDLRQPVPYVVARRRGRSARFVSLLEPYAASPAVAGFAESEPGVFSITGDGFVDRVSIGDRGVEYVRESK